MKWNVLSFAVLVPLVAVAKPIDGLFNTGMNGAGQLLIVGATDPHYALEGGVLKVMAPNSEWIGASGKALWIGVPSGGEFIPFETSFILPPYADLETVVLRGNLSSSRTQVFLNGILITGPWDCCHPQFRRLWPFELTGVMKVSYTLNPIKPFRHGQNVLRFSVAGTDSRVLLVTDLEGEVYPQARPFVRGDADPDGRIDIGDGIRILTFLFDDSVTLPCQDTGDVNNDGSLDLSDAVGLLGYLFLGTLSPPGPFPNCGLDLQLDDLACLQYGSCN